MNDDLHIDLGESTTKPPAQLRRPCEPEFVVDRVGSGEPEEPEVYLSVAAVEKLLAHLKHESHHEIGGLLCGHAAEDFGGRFVTITGAIAATQAQGERLCVTFTHEAWDELLAGKEREYPSEDVVGWYHTHPGLGVFLSEPDRFIQSSFFSEPTEIALVIDPKSFAWAVFHWHGEELRAVRRYFLYGRAEDRLPGLEQLLEEYAGTISRSPGT